MLVFFFNPSASVISLATWFKFIYFTSFAIVPYPILGADCGTGLGSSVFVSGVLVGALVGTGVGLTSTLVGVKVADGVAVTCREMVGVILLVGVDVGLTDGLQILGVGLTPGK